MSGSQTAELRTCDSRLTASKTCFLWTKMMLWTSACFVPSTDSMSWTANVNHCRHNCDKGTTSYRYQRYGHAVWPLNLRIKEALSHVSRACLHNHKVEILRQHSTSPVMSALPTQTQAATTNPTNSEHYSTLKRDITIINYPLADIQIRLTDNHHLSDTDIRNLFGHIRKAFLKTLWEQRSVELWTVRCKTLGRNYARTMDGGRAFLEDRSLQHAFYREQDEKMELKMQGEEREVVVAMIFNHVKLHRDAKESLSVLRAEKASLLTN